MKTALAQIKIGEDIGKNLEHILSLIEEAADEGADLITFPELMLCPFFPQYEYMDATKYSLGKDSDAVRLLAESCRKHSIAAVPNIYLKENGRFYDASLFIGKDGELSGASKMVHITRAPLFYEQDYYHPSDTGFRVYSTPFGKFGVIICFDRHMPESFRICTLKGAQMILIPTANISGEPLDLFEWEIRVAAMQNNVFIAMCNRVGKEDQMDFAGESIVVSPDGGVVAKAGGGEQLLYAEIDLGLAQNRSQQSFIGLRRPRVYSTLCAIKTDAYQYPSAY
jgi:predicted amidohydrolase